MAVAVHGVKIRPTERWSPEWIRLCHEIYGFTDVMKRQNFEGDDGGDTDEDI